MSRVEAAIREYEAGVWARQPQDVRLALGEQEDHVERQVAFGLATLDSDWFRSFLASDPAADWSRVRVPALAIFGGLDRQVPTELNEPAWRAALEAAGNEDATSVVLDDANHLFQAAGTGAVEEYARLEPSFTDDLLPILVGWVLERVEGS